MADHAIYDPSTGQVSASVLAPGQRLTPAGGQLSPADQPYEAGKEAPSTGPIPANVVVSPAGPFSRTKQG